MNSMLQKIENWSKENLVEEKTIAIILSGSAIQKPIEECNDIDIFIVNEEGVKDFYRREKNYGNKILDLNYITINELNQKLQSKAKNFFAMNWTSVYLELIRNGVVWYQKGKELEKFIELVNNWQWDESCYDFLKFNDHQEPTKMWYKKAYNEHLELLAILKTRIKNGEPVSYRRKDLPEMRKNVEEKKAIVIFETFMKIYKKLYVKDVWEEVTFAKKAMQKEDWDSAVMNIKDATIWLLKSYIREERINMLNPKVWEIIEKKEISEEMNALIKEQYS